MSNYAFSLPAGVSEQMKQFSEKYGQLFESARIASENSALRNLADNMKLVSEHLKTVKSPVLSKEEIEKLSAAYKVISPLISEPCTQIYTSETAVSDAEEGPINISETAISDAIDNVIPILDEIELPEPQREVIEEYKKSQKLTKDDIFKIISIIISFLTLLSKCSSDNQNKSDLPSETVIIDSHSEYNITQYFDNFEDSRSQPNAGSD